MGDAESVAHKVVTLAQQEFEVRNRTVTIGASVGIAFDADAQGGWKNLVHQADAMAYEAKRRVGVEAHCLEGTALRRPGFSGNC